MKKAIYFDMDGTLADLYAVNGWLQDLRAYNPRPYIEAPTRIKANVLARMLNRLRANGWTIGIISWLSKKPTPTYDAEVIRAKCEWLKRHFPSVIWDEIHIIPYGTPKSSVAAFPNGLLFDDEANNRAEWGEGAYDVVDIISILKEVARL